MGLASVKIFATYVWVANEREHAKYPGPKLKEFVTDPGVSSTKKEREDNARKQEQHEHGEDQKNPEWVQLEKKWSHDFQNLPLKILRKF